MHKITLFDAFLLRLAFKVLDICANVGMSKHHVYWVSVVIGCCVFLPYNNQAVCLAYFLYYLVIYALRFFHNTDKHDRYFELFRLFILTPAYVVAGQHPAYYLLANVFGAVAVYCLCNEHTPKPKSKPQSKAAGKEALC